MTDQKPEHNSIKERAKKKLERDMGPELLAALAAIRRSWWAAAAVTKIVSPGCVS